MKHISSIVAILIAFQFYASDLIVQDNGPSGTFSSISSAVLAAVNGDRILINNRLDNLPWVEDVLINKSIVLLSAVDNQKFFVNGVYTIERSAGRQVSIVGMRNSKSFENIKASGPYNANRTIVKLVANEFTGDVFSTNSNGIYLGGIDLYFAQNESPNCQLYFTYGQVIGNKLERVYLSSDQVSNSDTISIIGNDIVTNFTAFSSSNTTQNIYMANNYIANSSSAATVDFTSSPKPNSMIVNCTFNNTNGTSSVVLDGFSYFVINSSLDGRVTSFNSSMFLYNICSGNVLPTSGNNQLISTIVHNLDRSFSSSGWQDAGNPSNIYLDLDLTRNDIGCFGGSNSFSNFHPIDDGKSARVSFVTTPRVLYQGETFTPSIIGVDK
jgi:hypothetical protein